MVSTKPNSGRAVRILVWNLLAIVAVIGVLTALLFPRTWTLKEGKIFEAKIEMANLAAAIKGCQTEYGKVPVSSNVTGSPDFTFGTYGTSDEVFGITNASGYQANNSEVMAILMDLDGFPDGTNIINASHSSSPQRTSFLLGRIVSRTNSPGIGPDHVFRDPWGHPYIITIDLNGDNKCRDAFYKLASVSEIDSSPRGLLGLVRPTPPPYHSPETRDSFEVTNATVTIWSFGPDGKADRTVKANQGVNQDNLTSW
jgi:hypothetical protein